MVAALIAYNTGRWDEGLAEADAGIAMPDHYGMARALHGVAALVLLHRGDVSAARVRLERAERAVPRGIALFYEQLIVTARARLAELDGRPRHAVDIVRTVADGAVGYHRGHAISAVGGWLVRIAVNSGDRELARQIVDEIRDRTTDGSRGQRGALMFCQGVLDGDPELLLAAATEFADAGSPVAAAVAGDHAALVLAASGRPDDARTAHRAALSRFELVSAAGDIDRAAAALRAHGLRLGATGSRRRPRHGWEGLTGAETRVAALVAQGLTNREIAARLVVSVRTVHTHVSRILAKLGYSSRVEIVLGFPPRA
jgi:DNA-binding CsgD family transcriptional regulator